MDVLSPQAAYLLLYKESLNYSDEAYLRCLGDAFKACHPEFLKNIEKGVNKTAISHSI